MPKFEYRRLGALTYHVLTHSTAIKRLLLQWIVPEWQTDHQKAPEEPWTIEWLTRLPTMEFSLEIVKLADVRPRADLMSYQTATYSFATSLERRANKREEAILRGVSIEPLLVDRNQMELMDGYTRYTVLQRLSQSHVYAYLGGVTRQSTRQNAIV